MLIVVVATLVAYGINLIVLSLLRRIVQKTTVEWDDRIYRLLDHYLFPFLIVCGLLAIVDAVPLPPRILQAGNSLLVIIAILLVFFFLTRAALLILCSVEDRYEPMRNIKGPVEIVTKILFFAIGGMLILDNLGSP